MRETVTRTAAHETWVKLFSPGPTAAANHLARLRWTVDFAQSPAGKLEDRIALTVFPGVSAESGRVLILTEDETAQARGRILELLRKWASKGFYKIEDMPSAVYIQNDPSGPSILLDPLQDDYSDVTRVVLLVAFLLARDGHRVRLCHAPARYGKPGEECGRLFAGRLNQNYCSHLCQLRAGTHRVRKKAKRRPRHDKKKR